MTKPAQKTAYWAARDVSTELGTRIAAHAPSPGEHSTAITGLVLFRRTQATACYRAAVEPSLTVFVQGKKRMSLGGVEYICGPSSFFLSSIDVPIESQIVEASEEVPLLSMLLRLDMSIVREILNREDLPEADVSSQRRGVAVGQAPAGLLKACSRLMELLDIPEDIPFLSHLIQREIIYRILRTPQGARLRTIATTGDLGNRTARAINWLRDNYTKPLHLEELAGIARMGFDTSPSVPCIDRDEPASVSEAAQAAEGKGADAYGWRGCNKRGVRSRLRKCEPIQSRIRPFLRPTTDA